ETANTAWTLSCAGARDDTIRAPFSMPHTLLHFVVRICVVVAFTVSTAHGAKSPPQSGYAQRDDVRAFVNEVAVEHGCDRKQLLRWFAAAQSQPKIIAAMQRPYVEPPKWYEYAPQFLTAERIDGGVAYWAAHESELARAEREYGVPAEIIVA